jgi:hypothetical protein
VRWWAQRLVAVDVSLFYRNLPTPCNEVFSGKQPCKAEVIIQCSGGLGYFLYLSRHSSHHKWCRCMLNLCLEYVCSWLSNMGPTGTTAYRQNLQKSAYRWLPNKTLFQIVTMKASHHNISSISLPWGWRQVPLKQWYLSTKLGMSHSACLWSQFLHHGMPNITYHYKCNVCL